VRGVGPGLLVLGIDGGGRQVLHFGASGAVTTSFLGPLAADAPDYGAADFDGDGLLDWLTAPGPATEGFYAWRINLDGSALYGSPPPGFRAPPRIFADVHGTGAVDPVFVTEPGTPSFGFLGIVEYTRPIPPGRIAFAPVTNGVLGTSGGTWELFDGR